MHPNTAIQKRRTMMARMLAASALATFSAPAFAEDSVSTSASGPRMRVQAQFELLTNGSAEGTVGQRSMTTDLATAYGITGILDYSITPHFSIGAAPRLVLNINSKDAQDEASDKEIDLRLRLRGRFPVLPGLELYVAFSPGYVIILPGDAVNDATGFAVGGAAGLTYDISSRVFAGAEVGYQRAFTTSTNTIAGQRIVLDVDLSYLHVGLGAGARF
jgi:opacity protein-like surface antigen